MKIKRAFPSVARPVRYDTYRFVPKLLNLPESVKESRGRSSHGTTNELEKGRGGNGRWKNDTIINTTKEKTSTTMAVANGDNYIPSTNAHRQRC